MSFGDAPGLKGRLNLRWKGQQPNGIGDRRLAASDPLCDSLLGHPKLVRKALVGSGPFDRIQVLPLKVLDKRGF